MLKIQKNDNHKTKKGKYINRYHVICSGGKSSVRTVLSYVRALIYLVYSYTFLKIATGGLAMDCRVGLR